MRSEDRVISYSTGAKPLWCDPPIPFIDTRHQTNTIGQLDAGQHPAYDGLAALPYFDEFDLSTVDVLLISQ